MNRHLLPSREQIVHPIILFGQPRYMKSKIYEAEDFRKSKIEEVKRLKKSKIEEVKRLKKLKIEEVED
jgi:hypothetical protein